MKYPKAGELQREMSTRLTSNPCDCEHKNPYEVHSPSGLEGVFADPDDAEYEAEHLRKSGVKDVKVQPRQRAPQRPRRNPAAPGWRVSRSVTNMADNIEIFGGDAFKATSYFKYVGVDVDGVGYGWLHRCYDGSCIVELTDGEVDAFPASKVWPVSGYYPEHRGRARRNPAQRLFIGVMPTGIAYADRQRERDGDYLKVAFLPFSSLRLQWTPGNHPPELMKSIEEDANRIIARRGQPFQVDASGHTVILGGERQRGPSAPPQYHERQGRPPGVPNPSGKLGDPTSLGTWAAGSRVQLGVWEFPAHAKNGILTAGDWVTIVRNAATTTGYVVLRDESSGAIYERDGRSPLYSVDKARSVRA